MSWWKTALYDTCSLLALDNLFQLRPSFSRYFPKRLLALSESFSAAQMRKDTAERIMVRATLCSLPPTNELLKLLSSADLPKPFSDVDKLVFATAVHSDFAVVTEDKRLATSVQERGLEVGSVVLILQELVETEKLKSTVVLKVLQGLADQKHFLLRTPNPTMDDLTGYSFPN